MYHIMIICLAAIGLSVGNTLALQSDAAAMVTDYFTHKDVKHLVYLSCEKQIQNKQVSKHLMMNIGMVAMTLIDRDTHDLTKLLYQWNIPVGVLLDGSCNNTELVLYKASQETLFDASHIWVVLTDIEGQDASAEYIDEKFTNLNLSIDADIVVVSDDGLNMTLERFKYYDRWDFHNLTLRAVTVMLERPKEFHPAMLSDVRHTPGVTAMTKTVGQLLDVLKEQHNFRFKFTIADRWVGEPERNSTLAVTNSLYWREQDLSYTCLRIFPKWLDWMDPFFPPATHLETKFYYLMLDRGVGEYENRFAQPLSGGAWAGAGIAAALCALALAVSAAAERRKQPALHAICTVAAAVCQQAYEDGVQLFETTFSSQGRRLTVLVLGLTSMLTYNYYTSSVVSWLLSAAPPAIGSLDGLISSRLELVFEDIGYTRGWLSNPGFYYYSGFKNPKEDELRDKKVTRAKRTVPLFQSAEDGIDLIRTGAYAYHSEPDTAHRQLARRLGERELCQLATLQMMVPSHTYIVGQRRSPYKQFFDWSLARLLERGHAAGARARVRAVAPACSGRVPRALALGQAAPAFALLASAALLALLVLLAELLCHRFRKKQ